MITSGMRIPPELFIYFYVLGPPCCGPFSSCRGRGPGAPISGMRLPRLPVAEDGLWGVRVQELRARGLQVVVAPVSFRPSSY